VVLRVKTLFTFGDQEALPYAAREKGPFVEYYEERSLPHN
jgi:hypothetical protein